MSNPWLKKNPFMSMWLSGANSVASTARARIAVEAKRQTSTAVTKATNDMRRRNCAELFQRPVDELLRVRQGLLVAVELVSPERSAHSVRVCVVEADDGVARHGVIRRE